MNIAIVAGSNREHATSTQAGAYIAGLINQRRGRATLYDLYQNQLPFYAPDDSGEEQENVRQFKRLLEASDGIVLITPEYHGSLSGVLKNALDFASAHQFNNKPVLSVSIAGGAVGVSSLSQLQTIVRNLHGINSPEWLSIGGAQRSLFETAVVNPYDTGEGLALLERVQRVTDYFLNLVKLTRKGDEQI
ncbi:NAD(P)H-dependent oxidoreductase [Neobacillus mesonae]|nr:NAD(P)H-dependent oxidoreductase [Neobacillus mesonae]